MDYFKKFEDLLIYVGLIAMVVVFLMLILFRDTLNPYFVYISTVANIVVILLMLITINLTNKSTRKQIETFESSTNEQIKSWKHWDNIQRKQFIKSIIREIKTNIELYDLIAENIQKEEYYPPYYDFLLTSLGRSLYKSPVDDEDLNDNLMTIYFFLSNHNNRIRRYRESFIQQDYESLMKGILKDYERNKNSINSTIEMLKKYVNE